MHSTCTGTGTWTTGSGTGTCLLSRMSTVLDTRLTLGVLHSQFRVDSMPHFVYSVLLRSFRVEYIAHL